MDRTAWPLIQYQQIDPTRPPQLQRNILTAQRPYTVTRPIPTMPTKSASPNTKSWKSAMSAEDGGRPRKRTATLVSHQATTSSYCSGFATVTLVCTWVVEQRPPLLFFCFSAHDTSGLGRSFLSDVLILNLCFSGLAMASGRMILFLVFLFKVPVQAPESCSSLLLRRRPNCRYARVFLGGAGERPRHEKTMDAASSNSILFCFSKMFLQPTHIDIDD
jgi:hypothetical protein